MLPAIWRTTLGQLLLGHHCVYKLSSWSAGLPDHQDRSKWQLWYHGESQKQPHGNSCLGLWPCFVSSDGLPPHIMPVVCFPYTAGRQCMINRRILHCRAKCFWVVLAVQWYPYFFLAVGDFSGCLLASPDPLNCHCLGADQYGRSETSKSACSWIRSVPSWNCCAVTVEHVSNTDQSVWFLKWLRLSWTAEITWLFASVTSTWASLFYVVTACTYRINVWLLSGSGTTSPSLAVIRNPSLCSAKVQVLCQPLFTSLRHAVPVSSTRYF